MTGSTIIAITAVAVVAVLCALYCWCVVRTRTSVILGALAFPVIALSAVVMANVWDSTAIQHPDSQGTAFQYQDNEYTHFDAPVGELYVIHTKHHTITCHMVNAAVKQRDARQHIVEPPYTLCVKGNLNTLTQKRHHSVQREYTMLNHLTQQRVLTTV